MTTAYQTAPTAAPAPHAPSEDGRLFDADQIAAFMTAGKSTFTLVSQHTGTRYTYRIRANKTFPTMFFVETLVGSDNESDFLYIGYMRVDAGGNLISHFRTGSCLYAGQKGRPNDVRFKALSWLTTALSRDYVPRTVEFWHEGRCGRCNRKLTDPESIASGFGPECRKRV